eukprot:TRINITY_DN32724_c0_g1_i1.p1 TRINITY_DN32724_c0_g1~~TRINITY_DN32724_c0_g1_i1.p1  ORF type:complete len:1222 (+),score=212.32 TRINITY_DN32724_c0_g1_i1:98-3763(+)
MAAGGCVVTSSVALVEEHFVFERETEEWYDYSGGEEAGEEWSASACAADQSAAGALEEEVAQLRAELRVCRGDEVAEVAAIRERAREDVREQQERISGLEERVHDLGLEVAELGLRLARAKSQAEDSEREAARLRTQQQALRQRNRWLESLVVKQRRRLRICCGASTRRQRAAAERQRQDLLLRAARLRSTAEDIDRAAVQFAQPPGEWDDEAEAAIDPKRLCVSVTPDPVPIGHQCKVAIVTRSRRGQPCRGASAEEFELAPIGGAARVSAASGSRCSFTASFIPTGPEAGRQGLRVTFRGHTVCATTHVVHDASPADPARTTLVLAPNPCQAGELVQATLMTKNARELATAGCRAVDFAVDEPPGAGWVEQADALPSHFHFSIVAPQHAGSVQVAVTHGGARRTATLDVAPRGSDTPPLSPVDTLVACYPDPARVGEEVEVIVVTRDPGGAPCGGADVRDLLGVKPVGAGVDELQPIEQVSDSCFRTTFRARRAGSAGVTLRFRGLPLYATTTVIAGPAILAPECVSICAASGDAAVYPVGAKVAVRVTARDRWRAHCAFGRDGCDDWSLRGADGEAVGVPPGGLQRRGCSVLCGEVLLRTPGTHGVELLHQGKGVGQLTLTAAAASHWAPQSTRVTLRNESPWAAAPEQEGGALRVATLDSVAVRIETVASDGTPARPPDGAKVSIAPGAPGAFRCGPVAREGPCCWTAQVCGFVVLGACPLLVTAGGATVTRMLEVTPCGGPPDPAGTRVTCKPTTALPGDRVTATIGFFDRGGAPAAFNAADFASLDVEPLGQIRDLTRIDAAAAQRGGPGGGGGDVLYQELTFVCEASGECGVAVTFDGVTVSATCFVSSPDSLISGPAHLPATDVAVFPDPVRPGHPAECLITVRDATGAPLHEVETPQLHMVLRPLPNTGKVRPAVRPVPGSSSTWLATFTAGMEPGPTGVRVEISDAGDGPADGGRWEGRPPRVIFATATVEDDPLHRVDDSTTMVVESKNRLLDDVRRALSGDSGHPVVDRYEPSPELAPAQPSAQPPASLKPHYGVEVTDGMSFRTSDGSAGRVEYQGVKVVGTSGPARAAGITEDDIITHVGPDAVKSLEEFRRALRTRGRLGAELVFTTRREGGPARKVGVVPDARDPSRPAADVGRYQRRLRWSFKKDAPEPSGGADSVSPQPHGSADPIPEPAERVTAGRSRSVGSGRASPRPRLSSRSAEARRRR